MVKPVIPGLLLAACLQAPPPIMSYERYAQVRHSRPYILEIRQGESRFVFFGIGHTSDPQDRQIAILDEEWSRLRPEEAFHESGTPPSAQSFEDAVRKSGEPGYVRHRAEQERLLWSSLDPSREAEVKHLRVQFTAEQLRLFYTLRKAGEARRQGIALESMEPLLPMALARLDAVEDLKGSPSTLKEFERAMARLLPGKDWRDTDERWTWPGRRDSWLNDVATASSRFRDEHMVRRIGELMGSGRRIIAVMGASHVVMQEPALRALLPRAEFWVRQPQ